MRLEKKQLIKYIKSLEELGIKETKFTEETAKKFRVSEISVVILYEKIAAEKPINIWVVLFFILGLIGTTIGFVLGTIAVVFGIALVTLSIATVVQNRKYSVQFKRLASLKKK
ncbi:hypothetical protein [Cellulophaga baltica]|uniref:hypothetical protein n=1 Tax=Cellulophaga baltica TaxID=76594 RepID=UPI000407B666|nr:hypothetical protein [Cellulophaga baltica]